MKNKFNRMCSLLLFLLISLGLTACAAQTKKAKSLPTAQTIFTKAQNTKLHNLHANWRQTDRQGQTLQYIEAKYQTKPLLLFAKFTTPDNHYQMWVDGHYSYMQMQGTKTNKWFKTKMTKTSAYNQLTDDMIKNVLTSFTPNTIKLFKVSENKTGYNVTYSGNNQKLWQNIQQCSPLTSVIGIDINNAKLKLAHIKITTDKKYQLSAIKIDLSYLDTNHVRKLKMVIDQINQNTILKMPNIKTNAVNLTK